MLPQRTWLRTSCCRVRPIAAWLPPRYMTGPLVPTQSSPYSSVQKGQTRMLWSSKCLHLYCFMHNRSSIATSPDSPPELGNIHRIYIQVHEKKIAAPMVINLLKAPHLKHYALWLLILRTASFYNEITMLSNFIKRSTCSTMLKIYTSGNVNTFEGCFRAVLESPEKLLLN